MAKKTPEEIYKIDRIANLKKISEQFEIRAEWFSDEYVLNKFKTYDEKSVIDMAKAFLGSGVLQSIDQIHIIDQGGTPDRFDLESDLYSNMLKCGLAARKLFLKLKNKEAMKIAINFYEAAFEMNRDLDRREKRRYEKSKLTSR